MSEDSEQPGAADRSAGEPAEMPGGKPAETSRENIAESSAGEPAEMPGGKPAETSRENIAESSAGEPAKTPGEKPAEASRENNAETSAVEPAETPGEKPAETSRENNAESSAGQTAATPAAAIARARRDPRPFIYAGFDLAMAVIYAAVFFVLAPNRHGWVQALSAVLVLSPLVMAAAMFVRRPWSWWAGAISCGVLLLLALVYLILALTSAAFLAGVYGSFGRAGAVLMLVGAALVIELIALLPAFQLKFLMTRAGRRCFGRTRRAAASGQGDASARPVSDSAGQAAEAPA